MSAAKLPGLDGLRALAVLLVVVCHQYVLSLGWVGVQIFFVLSGYLINRLLVRDREQPLGSYLRDFYGRRALRIFPLYYAVLAVLLLASMSRVRMVGVREALPFAATYTYNFWYAAHGTVSYLLTHFWSLCVEEQFYLVWPFVIYLCPPRFIRQLLMAVILASPVVRAMMVRWLATHLHGSDRFIALDVVTPTHFDAFAIGAYASLFPLSRYRWGLLAAGSVLTIAGLVIVIKDHLPWDSAGYPLGMRAGYAFVWGYSLINVCAVLLITCLANRRFFPALFESRPLTYLGRISYGLYVLHYPVQWIVAKALSGRPVFMQIALQLPVTIALAALSYRYWESPFLALKDRWFPGRPRAAAPVEPLRSVGAG